MTGNELLKRAAALFGDADPTPTAAALSCLNVLLAENFEQHTRLRRLAGRGALAAGPPTLALRDLVPYEDALVYGAFSYGLAEKIFADERDAGLLSYLHQQYAALAGDCDRGFVRAVLPDKEAGL